MSNTRCYRDGSGFAWNIEMVVLRWGGGAHPGKYHMFLMVDDARAGLPMVSAQCVVDDFGNLVEALA